MLTPVKSHAHYKCSASIQPWATNMIYQHPHLSLPAQVRSAPSPHPGVDIEYSLCEALCDKQAAEARHQGLPMIVSSHPSHAEALHTIGSACMAPQAMSLPDWDFGSSCYLFTQCLSEIATFSAANPAHFPIVIFVHHGGTTSPQSYLGSEYSAALAQLQVSCPAQQQQDYLARLNLLAAYCQDRQQPCHDASQGVLTARSAAIVQGNTTVPPNNFTQGVNAKIPDIKTAILSVSSLPLPICPIYVYRYQERHHRYRQQDPVDRHSAPTACIPSHCAIYVRERIECSVHLLQGAACL